MILTHNGREFICVVSFSGRYIPREAGFTFKQNRWTTTKLAVAAKLRENADDKAKEVFAKHFIQFKRWFEPLPPTGCSLLPHQQQALEFVASRNRAYLGLDPGLGKTAVAACAADASIRPCFYICPPFLVENVHQEFQRWAPGNWVEIIPDNKLERLQLGKIPRNAFLVVDEAHRFKSPKAKRTQAVFNIMDKFSHVVLMSGTPMPNRPMELFHLLSKLAPETINFMSEFDFGRRYCAGHRTQFGWDFTGASHVEELAKRVIHPSGPFMLRIRKDVLDLPPKLEEIFVLSDEQPPKVTSAEEAITRKYKTTEDVIRAQLAKKEGAEDLAVATYRRLLGAHKAKAALPFLRSILEETDESLLIFAHHKETIAALAKGLDLEIPLVITGDTPVSKRQTLVNEFQDPKMQARVLIGNIAAMGVGFTLTKASRVVFVEFDWVPGVNDQASDRAHRIGQKGSVLVQYLVFKDSLDKRIIETLTQKRSTLAKL